MTQQHRKRVIRYGPRNPGDTMLPPAYASRDEADAECERLANTVAALGQAQQAGVYVSKIDPVWYGVYLHRYHQAQAS